jgi:hypothetical protein
MFGGVDGSACSADATTLSFTGALAYQFSVTHRRAGRRSTIQNVYCGNASFFRADSQSDN